MTASSCSKECARTYQRVGKEMLQQINSLNAT